MTPRPFRVERSRTIAAPAADIVRELEDFRRWVAWSPWEGSDPSMTREYDGAPGCVGSRYAWSGTRRAGAGSMEMLSADAQCVEIRLEFSRPMRADNTVRFDLSESDPGTRVTWSMTGETSGLAAVFSRIVPTDRLVGRDFERGLDQLAAVVTARAGRDG